MTDSASPPSGASVLIIPDDVRAKFPELIDLIVASESMNDEERRYWINILPIMTPEQIEDLRGILDNERKQLQAIDQKYAGEIGALGQPAVKEITDEDRKKKRAERLEREQTFETEDEKSTEELLKKIEGS